MSRVLDVYLHNDLAGKLVQTSSGQLSFSYYSAYLTQKKPALSISLALQSAPYMGKTVNAFFSGILPDSITRQRLAQYLGVSDKNAFALLEIIGGECAGAISLYPEGMTPQQSNKEDIEVLDDQRLHEILTLLRRRPLLAGDDGLRLSLAGVQDKLAVGVKNGRILLIKGNSPTTHILKPLIGDIQESVHNEFFCMQLADEIGINVAKTQMGFLMGTPYLLVTRYDRIIQPNHIQRLHQEDFCQALSIPPEIKYEREGGSNLKQCQALIKQYSIRPALDQIELLKRIIFNYIIGNADAHGKNFSLLYQRSKPELSPAYDLFCTAVYPELASKMAMKIGTEYKAEAVFDRHWYGLVPNTAVAKRNLKKQMMEMALSCQKLSVKLKNRLNNEAIQSPIFDCIIKVIEERSQLIIERL